MKGGFIVRGGNSSVVKDPNKPRQRPLGLVRKSVTSSIESVPKFPPLKQTDRNINGLTAQGNAMQVPTYPENPESDTRTTTSISQRSQASPIRKPISSSKSVDSTATSAKSDEKARELKEALGRERQLKQEINQLQKVIDDLREQIKDKDQRLLQLQAQAEQRVLQEEKYKQLYEAEKVRHEDTRVTLDKTCIDLELANTTITNMQETHVKQITDLKALMEGRLDQLREEKDSEISVRDEKLNKLKKQMADALKGNSWERQQQLDELTKELSRVQEESDNLRFKIKSLQKSKVGSGGNCSNCDSSKSQLSAAQKSVKERDLVINDLKQLCIKFEKQIDQKDQMLRKFAEQNGTAFK